MSVTAYHLCAHSIMSAPFEPFSFNRTPHTHPHSQPCPSQRADLIGHWRCVGRVCFETPSFFVYAGIMGCDKAEWKWIFSWVGPSADLDIASVAMISSALSFYPCGAASMSHGWSKRTKSCVGNFYRCSCLPET